MSNLKSLLPSIQDIMLEGKNLLIFSTAWLRVLGSVPELETEPFLAN